MNSSSSQSKSEVEMKIQVEGEIGKEGLDTNQILENKKHVSKPLDHILSRHENVGGFKTPEPSEKPAQVKEKTDTVSNVLTADPQENEEDMVQDMQILPTGSVENVKISPRMHVSHMRSRDSSSSGEMDGANERQEIVCNFHAMGWCVKGVNCRFLHVERSDPTVKCEDKSALTCHRKEKINTARNVLKADPQENGDVNAVRSETVDNDVVITHNATTGNGSAVEDMVQDMDISPTGSVENVKISPRMHVSYMRTRDSSSSGDMDGANKTQKIVCNFHAMGWCVKGVNCRFLHVERSNPTAKCEDKSALTCHRKEKIDTVRNALKADPQENGDVNAVRSETLGNDVVVTYNATMGNGSAVEDMVQDMDISPTGSVENVKISPRMHVPRMRTRDSPSSGEMDGANKRQKIKVCEFHAKGWCVERVNCRFPHVEGSDATVKCEASSSAHISAVSSAKPDARGMLNDRKFFDLSFSHPKQPSSSYLPSWNTNNYGTHKPVESILVRRPSISTSVLAASPLLYGQSGNNLQTPIFKDPNDYMSKTTLSWKPFDWEPSVPFRPSHPYTMNLLSKANLYDPQRDSIAQTKVREELGNTSESGKDLLTMNVTTQSNRLEEVNKAVTDVNSMKERVEKYKDIALKPFQAALIEHVKDLIKPTWQMGFMSIDAHKLIVKKSVSKVLSSLENEEIPITSQEIQSYISRSESKLASLVEAYVEIHGKSNANANQESLLVPES